MQEEKHESNPYVFQSRCVVYKGKRVPEVCSGRGDGERVGEGVGKEDGVSSGCRSDSRSS